MGRKAREKSVRSRTDEQTALAAPPPLPEASPDARLTAALAAVLVALVAIVFAQLRTHQFLNYDDTIYVTANQHVKAGLTLEGVRWAFTSMDFNWHPLTWLSHMLDVQLFGVNAGAHLLVSAAIHAINVVLLLLLLTDATRRLWRSAFVAALFAVHPMHVESVAWLSERKDVLSTLFFLLTVWLYVRFTRSRSKPAYAALIATFILGLMCKGMLVTLPFVLVLLDYWPLKRIAKFDAASIRSVLFEKLPLFAIVIPAIWVTYRAQQTVGSLVAVQKAPLLARLANAAIAYIEYIGKLFWPSKLAIPYPYRVVISPTAAIACALLLISICAVVFALRRREPPLFVGWYWFFGTLVPVIGIVQIGIQAMADRYTYIPSIGFFIAVTWLAAEALEHFPALRRPAWAAAAAVVLVCTFVSYLQASYWRNSETLFRHSVAVTNNNTYAYISLGKTLLEDKHQPAAAAQMFQTALAIFPDDAAAHQDLGAAYGQLGRFDDAAREFQRAIEIEPTPDRYRNLAVVEQRRGNSEKATEAFTQFAAAQGDIGALATQAMERGDINGALVKYGQAIQQKPNSADLHNNYASALAKAGRDYDAMNEYQAALKLDPTLYDARMNIGAVLSRNNRNAEAVEQFQIASKLRPQSTEPHVYLALAFAQLHRNRDALGEAKAAAAIDEKKANDQFTSAIHAPASPDNLRQFMAAMQSGR